MLLGVVLALYLYPRLSSADVAFHEFALFMGTAISVTAFPVLARILRERQLHDTPLGAMAITGRFELVATTLLLPIFFAYTGLRTEIALVAGVQMWAYCGIILLVAIVGKLFGSALAARVSGLPWRESTALGVLMNTRGLMELVVLNIGLDLGIISPAVFSMLVLMALVTTFMTTPLLTRVLRSSSALRAAPPLAATSAGGH